MCTHKPVCDGVLRMPVVNMLLFPPQEQPELAASSLDPPAQGPACWALTMQDLSALDSFEKEALSLL